MNIAVFTDNFYPHIGGTEKAVYSLCTNLSNLGHKVVVFCPKSKGNDTHTYNFQVVRMPTFAISKYNETTVPLFNYHKMKKVLKDFKPNLIYYATGTAMATCALKMAKKFKVKTVATMHTKFYYAVLSSTKSKLIAKCFVKRVSHKLNKTDYITTVCNEMVGVLHKQGVKKDVVVIRNGVDKVPAVVKEKPDRKECFNFMFCGHVIQCKNIQFSLKCLALLKEKYNFSNFKFYIVGGGDYDKKLKKLAKKLGISENVVFTGMIKDKQKLNEYYQNAHLFLFPSYFDTDGLVCLEAGSNGTPTLAIKGYGASERIVNNETGFVEEYDKEKFTAKIWEIINNNDLYNKVQSNVYNLEGKSWEEISKEYLALFEKVAK